MKPLLGRFSLLRQIVERGERVGECWTEIGWSNF